MVGCGCNYSQGGGAQFPQEYFSGKSAADGGYFPSGSDQLTNSNLNTENIRKSIEYIYKLKNS